MSTVTNRRAGKASAVGDPVQRAPTRRVGTLELAGLIALAAALAALLAHHVLQADGFFLDDWLYTHAAEYIGQHAPGAAWGEIPNWTRGAQRLYPILIAPPWALLSASSAYTVSHLINVALLTSSIVPAALIVRRLVDDALLRVLAVALAVVLPPLTIGTTLLTENLAMPLLLWAVYLTARTAERPTLLNQVATIACIVGLTLTRLNLAVTFGAVLVTVAVAELLSLRDARGDRRAWLVAALRRRAPVLLAALAGAAALVWVSRSGGSGLGAYSGSASGNELRAMWTEREAVLAAVATHARSMVVGAFVFPFTLGLAGVLAAVRGAMGRRAVIAGVAALACFALTLLTVSGSTRHGPFEERYAFYLYPPIALFAVAAVQHLRRIPVEIVVAAAATLWVLDRGALRPSNANFHFFDAPGGAFWNRVVEHRLVRLEGSLPGWLPASQSGWQLIALALLMLIAVALVARFGAARVSRVPLVALLSTGLAMCLVAQALALNYSFGALLHGFSDAPGGYAGAPGHAADRYSWIDDTVPSGANVALLAPMVSPGAPYGGAESTEYWNRSVDAVVALRYTYAPIVAAAGHDVVESTLQDGVATWAGPDDIGWLATARDDPRAQFAGAVSPARGSPRLTLVRLAKPVRAVWSVTGLEPDGYAPSKGAAEMTLSRGQADGVRSVRLSLRGADGLPRKASFRITRDGARPVTGDVRPGKVTMVTLRAPRCEAACAPVSWRLTTSGRPAMVPLPVFGAPPPPRPVRLQITAARLLPD